MDNVRRQLQESQHPQQLQEAHHLVRLLRQQHIMVHTQTRREAVRAPWLLSRQLRQHHHLQQQQQPLSLSSRQLHQHHHLQQHLSLSRSNMDNVRRQLQESQHPRQLQEAHHLTMELVAVLRLLRQQHIMVHAQTRREAVRAPWLLSRQLRQHHHLQHQQQQQQPLSLSSRQLHQHHLLQQHLSLSRSNLGALRRTIQVTAADEVTCQRNTQEGQPRSQVDAVAMAKAHTGQETLTDPHRINNLMRNT
jgi:hypothetical protein